MGDSVPSEKQVSLPTAELIKVSKNISLLPPLSRKGHGPGLIIVLSENAPRYPQGGVICVDGVPPPLLKWAEEGFAVVEIRHDQSDIQESGSREKAALQKAVGALEECEQCDSSDGIGMICGWSSSPIPL